MALFLPPFKGISLDSAGYFCAVVYLTGKLRQLWTLIKCIFGKIVLLQKVLLLYVDFFGSWILLLHQSLQAHRYFNKQSDLAVPLWSSLSEVRKSEAETKISVIFLQGKRFCLCSPYHDWRDAFIVYLLSRSSLQERSLGSSSSSVCSSERCCCCAAPSQEAWPHSASGRWLHGLLSKGNGTSDLPLHRAAADLFQEAAEGAPSTSRLRDSPVDDEKLFCRRANSEMDFPGLADFTRIYLLLCCQLRKS